MILPSMKMMVCFLLCTDKRRKSLENTKMYQIFLRVWYEAGSLVVLEPSKAPLKDLC